MKKLNDIEKRTPLIFFLLFLLFSSLFFRNSAGIFPGLLDEYYYSQFSRLLPLSQAKYGNYLFDLIYGVTNICRGGFLTCTYFLNALFYTLAFFPIYAILDKVSVKKSHNLAIAFLCLLYPFNYWTGLFMPESLYFLWFWIFIWSLLSFHGIEERVGWIARGAILGIASLIKIHAIFLMPAGVVYIGYLAFLKQVSWNSILAILKNSLAFTIGIFLVKFGIGYLLAGSRGLSIFGSYGTLPGVIFGVIDTIGGGGLEASTSQKIDQYFTPWAILQREGLKAISINAMPIFICFGAGIAITVLELHNYWRSRKITTNINSDNKRNLYFITLVSIPILFGIVSTHQLVEISLASAAAELYWRYYEFSFLLILLCTIAVPDKEFDGDKCARYIIGLPIFLITFVAIYYGKGNAWVTTTGPKMFYIIGFISCLSTLVWIFKKKWGINVFVYVLTPLIIVVSNIAIYKNLETTRFATNDSSIGAFINAKLSKNDLERLVVVQDDDLTQTVPLIYLNVAIKSIIRIPKDQVSYDVDSINSNGGWLLIFGNHRLTGRALSEPHMDLLSFGGATLFGGHGNINLDMRKSEWQNVVRNHEGLFFPPEPWGTWSIGERVVFNFSKPLPRRFYLILEARAYGPNLNKDFMVSIGGVFTSFQVNSFPEFVEKKILIDNPSKFSRLEIIVPNPTSPSSLGSGSDDRKLGIGLSKLRIEW